MSNSYLHVINLLISGASDNIICLSAWFLNNKCLTLPSIFIRKYLSCSFLDRFGAICRHKTQSYFCGNCRHNPQLGHDVINWRVNTELAEVEVSNSSSIQASMLTSDTICAKGIMARATEDISWVGYRHLALTLALTLTLSPMLPWKDNAMPTSPCPLQRSWLLSSLSESPTLQSPTHNPVKHIPSPREHHDNASPLSWGLALGKPWFPPPQLLSHWLSLWL